MPTLLEIINPGYWLKRAAYGRDLFIFDIIKNWPILDRKIKNQLYYVLIGYSSNNGFKTVPHNLLNRLESRDPISLYELDRLFYILNYSKISVYNPDNSDGQSNEQLDYLISIIEPYRKRMRAERTSLDSHDRIIEEQDYTRFNAKMLRASIWAAIISAIAAVISTYFAVLSYFAH